MAVLAEAVSAEAVSAESASPVAESAEAAYFTYPLSLDVNLQLIVRIEVDGASAATKASGAASAAASDNGESRPITIPIMCGETRKQRYQ